MTNIAEMQSKLYEKLKPSGWGDKLKTFITGHEFHTILTKLVEYQADGERFVPQLKYLFTAFERCPYADLKVILIGQDPYPYLNVPDGMAFSCSIKNKEEASLKIMFDEIERTVYGKDGYERNPDLSRWAEQGILLLNSALTVTLGKPGSHSELWKPFIAFLMDILSKEKPDLIYLFIGRKAEYWADYIPVNSHKVIAQHPAASSYSGSGWKSNDCFNKVNELMFNLYKSKITW